MKRRQIDSFITNSAKSNISEKIAVVKTVQRIDKGRFRAAFNKLRREKEKD